MTTDKILAIDVGTVDSGYAIMRFDKDDIKLLSFGKIANEALMQIIKNNGYDQLVYEQFQSFGMAESTGRKKSSVFAIPCGRKMPISVRH